MGKKFRVVFTGQIQPGRNPDEILEGIARLFKTDTAKVRALFIKAATRSTNNYRPARSPHQSRHNTTHTPDWGGRSDFSN